MRETTAQASIGQVAQILQEAAQASAVQVAVHREVADTAQELAAEAAAEEEDLVEEDKIICHEKVIFNIISNTAILQQQPESV